MNQHDAARFWFDSAQRSATIARDNFRLKHYDWALFLWHLTLEKAFKGIIVKKEKLPPPIHDLVKLAGYAKLKLDEEKESHLKEITTFNIEARYDDYKKSFYHKATKSYADKWSNICSDLYLWLQKLS